MADILQITFLNAFDLKKNFVSWLKFLCSFFERSSWQKGSFGSDYGMVLTRLQANDNPGPWPLQPSPVVSELIHERTSLM